MPVSVCGAAVDENAPFRADDPDPFFNFRQQSAAEMRSMTSHAAACTSVGGRTRRRSRFLAHSHVATLAAAAAGGGSGGHLILMMLLFSCVFEWLSQNAAPFRGIAPMAYPALHSHLHIES